MKNLRAGSVSSAGVPTCIAGVGPMTFGDAAWEVLVENDRQCLAALKTTRSRHEYWQCLNAYQRRYKFKIDLLRQSYGMEPLTWQKHEWRQGQ